VFFALFVVKKLEFKMDKTSLFNKVKKLGLNTREEYMAEAFSRNIGLLTQAEQDKLANAKVAIPGMEVWEVFT